MDLLARKTEGWIVGLRLAALSVQGLPDVEAFVQEFEGTSSAYLTDYLLGEVLNRQRPAVQDFLLKASLLDRFCASLCDAVLDERPRTTDEGVMSDGGEPQSSVARALAHPPASPGEAILDELNRANLFLVSLDRGGIWYRFHHLFQGLLRHRLVSRYSAPQVAALRARATAWFVEQGLVDEALDHALAAGDVAGAAQIVEQHRKVVLVDDQWHNLARWLDRLPAEIKQQRRELQLAQAWILWDRLDLEALPAILEDLETAFAREGASDPVQGEMDFFRGYMSYFQTLGLQAEEFYKRATERIPETYHTARWEAELHHALARHMNGHKVMAVDRLTDLIHSQRPSKAIGRTRLWAGLCFIHLLEGALRQAIHPAQQVQRIAATVKNRHVCLWGSYLEALVHFHWNDLERAVQQLVQLAGELHVSDRSAAVDSLCALSLAYQHLQRPEQADETVRRLLEFVGPMKDRSYETIVSSLQARLALLRGDTASALRWLRTADLAADAGLMLWWLEIPHLTECRVLIAEGSDVSLEQAIDKLERYDQENEAVHNTCQRITILPLLALATHKLNRTDEALVILGRAVALAEPGGFIQPFADLGPELAALLQELVAHGIADGSLEPATIHYLYQLSPALPQPDKGHIAAELSSAAGLVEPLTEREMEVLTLLSRRLSNQEIARELVITVGTVKQHTNRIYGKLGVEGRRQAVDRASTLGLLSPA
jgi:LuxR family maltose regulon positive regulatory protein